ncbi:hypothetical protein [Xylella taiwanensis]|nr:hypothetical protein [Xylella taiwanensis]MCD8458051.1 hypothetical protein [Xylella taiwanensis]QKD97653.1 hypothetical protein PLS229_00985 [Xylella taiwanensis]UFN05394.1 hypothetical protein LPH41_05275 [Xylella taiwanensis]
MRWADQRMSAPPPIHYNLEKIKKLPKAPTNTCSLKIGNPKPLTNANCPTHIGVGMQRVTGNVPGFPDSLGDLFEICT